MLTLLNITIETYNVFSYACMTVYFTTRKVAAKFSKLKIK